MADYIADMRDLRFNLFDFLDAGALCQTERFKEFDSEIIGDVLDMAYAQATDLLGPLSEQGDREGVKLVDGKVKTPDGWPAAYKTYRESGWVGLGIPQKFGGQGLPFMLGAAVQELHIGANISFMFTPGLTSGALGILCEFGTEDQHAVYLEKMVSGVWSGTMALTEPQAGTAVPDLKASAKPIEGKPGFFKIKGSKIFISSGDQDFTENIVHMVLARVEGDPPGNRGVSLFIVPKFRPTSEGKPGEFNDVTCVALEEKMGIHASPTCQLSFGDEGECEGWLIGKQGEGLRCMFKMMNEARLAVALQGVALANIAYQRSLAYAKERVQGTRIQDMRKADAERVAIIEHPDVRRMLMTMKAIAEGSRALGLYAALCADKMHAAKDDNDRKRWHHQLELLTPIAKAWCSDEGFKATEMAIQVHGGYGYIREYGVEQLARDCKIASIYEGTNGIQALDLIGRKVSRGGGVMLMTMLNEVNQFLKGPVIEGPFAEEAKALAKARDALSQVSMSFGQRMMKGDPTYPALHACNYLQMFGDLLVGWLLLRQAVKAKNLYDQRIVKLDIEELDEELGGEIADDPEARFLHGKIATANFFIHQILPRVFARKAQIDSGDRSALDVVL